MVIAIIMGFSPRIGGRKQCSALFTHRSMSLRKRLLAFRLSPQWGSNSKECNLTFFIILSLGFSPRNGEIILKDIKRYKLEGIMEFQSPQWGDNSKAIIFSYLLYPLLICFSPRNGEIILKSFLEKIGR